MYRLRFSAMMALALLSAPAMAQKFPTPGNAGAYPIEGTTFEVVVTGHKGSDIFWCGASHYARRVLGASWDVPISISRSLGNSQVTGRRSAVQFTLDPQASGIEPIRSSDPGIFPVGDTQSVREANMGCNESLFRMP